MKDLSIKKVTILAFLATILILIIYLIINNILTLKEMREKTMDNVYNSVQIIGTRTDQNLNKIEIRMIEKTLSTEVISILSKEQKNTQYHIELKRIRDRLNEDIQFLQYESTMFVYYNSLDELVMSGNQSESLQQDLKALIHDYMKPNHELWQVISFNGQKCLMVMYCNDFGIYAGSLITIESILQEWENLNIINSEKSQYFTGSDNICVQSSENTQENENVFKSITEDNRVEEAFWENNNLIARYDMLGGAYRVFVVVGSEYGTTVNSGVLSLICMIPILAGVTFFTYYFILNRLLLKPLQQALSKIYTEMEKESITLPNVSGFSEVNGVIKLFNNILQHLRDVKIKLYEEKIENERIKMHILQSQINPHMFMNSLAIINGMAKIKTDESTGIICKLTKYMSEHFRFILESNRDFIDLEDEIKNAENYLKIQNIRYPELFQFNIEAENLQTVKIPPLTLQPIVENSIKHGFNGYENFTVNVTCIASEDLLTVRVSDNGVGFSKESLQMIESGSDTDIHNKRHFGIKNVYDLLKLAYPKGVTLRCFNDNGAVVEFLINL